VTREERVFFPVERTGPPGGGRPAATLRALPVPSEPMSTNSNVVQQLYRLYSQLYTLYVLYTLTASKAHHALSPVPFSLKADPRISCPSGPRFAPPSPWWHMGSPPPIAASRRARCARERAARACASRSASRIYIAEPPPTRGSCTIPARIRSVALPAVVSLRSQFSSRRGCTTA